MHEISTRVAGIHDVEHVAELFDAYRQFYGKPADRTLARSFVGERLRRRDSVLLLAERDGRIVGFCHLYPTFCSVVAVPIYVLYDLFVAPEVRKSGAGRALMLAAERIARENRVARIDLSTAKTNRSAQSLYESLGWKRDDEFFVYSKTM